MGNMGKCLKFFSVLFFCNLIFLSGAHSNQECHSIENQQNLELYSRVLTHLNQDRITNLCLSLSRSESSGPGYNVESIKDDLWFYKNSELKELLEALKPKEQRALSIEALDHPVSQNLIALFNEVQTQVFGRGDLLELKYCKNCHSFTASYEDMRVYLPLNETINLYTNPRFSNPNNAMAFVFAHEISHFLQNSFSKRNENITASELVYLPTADSSQIGFIRTIGQIQTINTHLHSEVDHYALEIYNSLGRSDIDDVLLWFIETSWSVASRLTFQSDFSPLMDLNFRRLQLEHQLSIRGNNDTTRIEYGS